MPLGKTPILQNDTMAQGDNNKYVLYNTSLVAIEDSENRTNTADFTAGNVTLTETELLRYGIQICVNATAPRNLIIPTTVGSSPSSTTNRKFGVINQSGYTITVTHGSGNTVDVPNNSGYFVHADGTDIYTLAGDSLNEFVSLIDTPASYTGHGLKIVRVNSGATALEFVDNVLGINDQSGTSYDLIATDARKLVRMDNAAANTVTVQDDSDVDFPIGTEIWVRQIGVGATTIVEDTLVTINTADNLAVGGVNHTAKLIKVAANEWDMQKIGATSITLLSLTDTPSSYSGHGGKTVKVNSGETAIEFVDDVLTINDQSGASYNLVAADAHALVRMSNASANTVTVQDDSDVDFPIGTEILIRQVGAGATTIAEDTSVTINAPGGLIIGKQHAAVRLVKVAANTWDLIRDPIMSILEETSTSRSSSATDLDNYVEMNNAAANTYTVEPAIGVKGNTIIVEQTGAGTTTLVQGTGVTINKRPGLTLALNGQHSVVTLVCKGSNVWTAYGDLA